MCTSLAYLRHSKQSEKKFHISGVAGDLLSDSAEAESSSKKLAKVGAKAGAKAGGFALKAVSGLVKNKAASKALGRVGEDSKVTS